MYDVRPVLALEEVGRVAAGGVTPVCIYSMLSLGLVAHVADVFRMKTWTRTEGGVRLSEDDGPAATEFLGDDLDEDGDDGIEWDNRDRELPAERGRKLTTGFARPIDGDIGGAPT